MAETDLIRTPDQRLRVFVSSTLQELAAERQAVRDAVTRLRLVPVMFELGARPHPPRQVYRSYLAQSQVFVGVYWQSYGWVAPGEQVSGLEDEYLLSAGLPRLIYVKSPAPERESRLAEMLTRIRDDGDVSYQHFSAAAELQRLVENDLAVLLSERFEMAPSGDGAAGGASLAGALPVPATPLVGRDDDAAAVGDLVRAEGVRLVTLTGPGGVGKSRLAVEVAQRLGPGFQDGVRFVELGSVRAAELVTAAIAAALGLNTSGGALITDLKSYLRARRLVLVLDNFEQVMGAAPLVAELLGAAPGVVALVTSRMVLRLSGEHEFPVPTLPVPPIGAGGDAAEVQRCASVRLFVQRAQAASAGFELTSGNAGAVAEICRRLDGLPLAIELAAARVRLLPPQALLARLDDRMGLLTGGARDLPERQQTLRSTLDWSFDLLSGGEQALFARLGVFAGTFDLPAAEAVGAAAARRTRAGPGTSWTRWARWWTAAWCSRRPATASRASDCWRPSGSTRWSACATALTGGRRTTGTRPTSWRSPSRLQPSCRVPGSWRGWTGSRPSTATSAPRCPGWWNRTSSSRRYICPGRHGGSGGCAATPRNSPPTWTSWPRASTCRRGSVPWR